VGRGVASAQRVVVGQDNEVYDVVSYAGHEVIVRISHDADPRFEGERWALDAVRARGCADAEGPARRGRGAGGNVG
jgi:hypothetical protein